MAAGLRGDDAIRFLEAVQTVENYALIIQEDGLTNGDTTLMLSRLAEILEGAAEIMKRAAVSAWVPDDMSEWLEAED